MKCPRCGNPSEVTDSRPVETHTRRRRCCIAPECNYLFTTHEVLVETARGRGAKATIIGGDLRFAGGITVEMTMRVNVDGTVDVLTSRATSKEES